MKKLLLTLSFALVCSVLWGQRTISGTVTDDSNQPLIGASVFVKDNAGVGTITDFEGYYELSVPEDASALVISYTGYETKEVAIGASNTINIELLEGVTLEAATVTALGIAREEKSLGYAVQELDGDAVAAAKETNLVNALPGTIAGVQIGGAPSTLGGSSRILIRGASSFLGNNQPLFVVDGVPMDNSNFASNSQMRGFGDATAYDYGNTIQDIDPQSIEKVSVLKGAAASALYGQRGANGVILITTKNGSGKKGLGVEINSNTSFETAQNFIPHQQVYGGGAINGATTHGFNEVIDTDGETYLYPTYSKDGSWGPKYDPNVNVRHWDSWDPNNPETYRETRPWVAPENDYTAFFQQGLTLTNSVALSGANDKGSFRAGYTNLDQTGVIPEGELQRNSFSLNSQYNLSDKVRVGVSGNYVRTDAENRNVTGYNNANPMQAFTQWWQTQLDLDRLQNTTLADGTQMTWNARGPQRDGDGNLLFYDHTPNFFDNPYWVRQNYLQEDTRNRFFGNANVAVDLLEGLTLNGRIGTDFYQFSLREGIPVQSVETSYYGETERRFQETNMELRLDYEKTFGRLSINALAGGNRMRQLSRRSSVETNGGILLDGFYNISNSAEAPIAETYEFNWGINSLFASVSFGWDNWIYLDVSARNDWSSTLPEGENSYFYPAVSTSFVLSELPFLQGNDIVSFLKVRASYAQVGNDASPYSLTNVYSPLTPNFNSAPRYGVPNSRNNPALRPELTSEVEFGLDARLLNDRISLGVSYYDRTTADQIFAVPTSVATGFTSSILNAGEMRNWGYEVQASFRAIQTKDFSWDIGVNAFRQFNEVVSLADGVQSIARGATWAADLRIQEGRGYMALFGQDYVYDDNGNRMVDDNGNYMFTDERVFLGSAIADWTGGISTTLNYKNFQLSALVDFQEGGVIHSTSLQWAKYSGMHPETVEFNGESDTRANGMVLPGVKADGTPNDIRIDPQTYYQSFWNRAAPNVYEASFVKLREVRLSYTLPSRFLGDSFLRGLNVSVYGRNLAILSSDLPFLDPQIITGAGNDQGLENAQVPSTRSVGFNLTFKF
jgi:TonB-linked SusC/RagA family outer membrane protein